MMSWYYLTIPNLFICLRMSSCWVVHICWSILSVANVYMYSTERKVECFPQLNRLLPTCCMQAADWWCKTRVCVHRMISTVTVCEWISCMIMDPDLWYRWWVGWLCRPVVPWVLIPLITPGREGVVSCFADTPFECTKCQCLSVLQIPLTLEFVTI